MLNYFNLLSLLLSIAIISCDSNNKIHKNNIMDQDIKKVEKLFSALKNDALSIDNIIDEHFLYIDQVKQDSSKDSKFLLDAYVAQLTGLRMDLNNQKCEIHTWETAEKKNADANKDLLENDIPLKDVFVVFVQDKPKYYFKMKDEKVQSVTPMLKGDLITGWL